MVFFAALGKNPQIHVTDFVLCGVDAKRQTTISGDAEAPCSFTVAGQRVHLPRDEGIQFVRIFHVVEEGPQFFLGGRGASELVAGRRADIGLYSTISVTCVD